MSGRHSVAVRRIHSDLKELATDPSDMYHALPREDDLFDWHFTVRGPPGSDFEGGLYHGRIVLPHEYPFRPPNITFMTPNGRFETNKKICLSISAYHPEEWQPAWGIRTILEALIAFFPTKGDGAIGALDWTKEERQKLVPASQKWRCGVCGATNAELIPKLRKNKKGKGKANNKYAAQVAQMHMHNATGAAEVKKDDAASSNDARPAGTSKHAPSSAPASSNASSSASTAAPKPAPLRKRAAKPKEANDDKGGKRQQAQGQRQRGRQQAQQQARRREERRREDPFYSSPATKAAIIVWTLMFFFFGAVFIILLIKKFDRKPLSHYHR